jgi:hypothetical protein
MSEVVTTPVTRPTSPRSRSVTGAARVRGREHPRAERLEGLGDADALVLEHAPRHGEHLRGGHAQAIDHARLDAGLAQRTAQLRARADHEDRAQPHAVQERQRGHDVLARTLEQPPADLDDRELVRIASVVAKVLLDFAAATDVGQ